VKKIILLVSFLFVGIDQIIKAIVVNSLEVYESVKVIPNFFYLTLTRNDGAAFGIMSGGRWLFIFLGISVLIMFFKFMILDEKVSKFDFISYSLVIGGIIGNLIDRIIHGYVIDYLDFYVFKYDAPIFNFADMCIVIGTFMIIYTMFFGSDNNEKIFSIRRCK